MYISEDRLRVLAQSMDNIVYNMGQLRYSGMHQSQRYQQAQSELKGWNDALTYAGLSSIVNQYREFPKYP